MELKCFELSQTIASFRHWLQPIRKRHAKSAPETESGRQYAIMWYKFVQHGLQAIDRPVEIVRSQ